ncbi:MAG: hypothetical protein QMC78_04060 [Methanocellales archaeon]|nr:hypothetical protein [Methanocellales archaeon]
MLRERLEILREKALLVDKLPGGLKSGPLEREYLELENMAKLNPEVGEELEEVYLLLIRAKFGKIQKFSFAGLLRNLLIASALASMVGCTIILLIGIATGALRYMAAPMMSAVIGVTSAIFCHELAHTLIAERAFGIVGTVNVYTPIMIGLIPRVSEEIKASPHMRLAAYTSGLIANLILSFLVLVPSKIFMAIGIVNMLVFITNLIPISRGLIMTDGRQILREIEFLRGT